MHLTLFITFLIWTAWTVRLSIFVFITPFVAELHQGCLNWLPSQAEALPELQALVCGGNFSQVETSELYIATGLIHLFVVSGAHLILIQAMIDYPLRLFENTFEWPEAVRPALLFLILLFYAGVCDFNPPVTRSLMSLLLCQTFIWGRSFWRGDYKLFIAGLLTLLINPQWVQSISFQLSWLIGLSLEFSSQFLKGRSILLRQSLSYVFIFPTLLLFQFPNPLTILMNVIFAPFLEYVLFPSALLTGIFPFLVPVFDTMIICLKFILSLTEMKLSPPVFENSDVFTLSNWIFILLIHCVLHFYNLVQERKRPCTCFV